MIYIRLIISYIFIILRYPYRILMAIDQLINTILFGSIDETLSARSYRNARTSIIWYIFRVIIDMLFIWQYNTDAMGRWIPHCYSCYLHEMRRGDLPDEYHE